MKRTLLLVTIFIVIAFSAEAQKIVTITGKILNPQSNSIHIKYLDNFLEMKEITAGSAVLDKEGKFGMTFEWNVASPALIYHGEKSYRMFLTPGDKLKVTLDSDRFYQSTQFVGKGAEVNNFLTKFDFKFNFGDDLELYNESFKKYKLEEFTIYINKRKVDEIKFYDEYFTVKPSKEFDNYITSVINYAWAADRINYLELYPFFNKKKGFVKVAVDYYNFMDKIEINNETALSTYHYIHFLDSYFDDLSYKQLDKKEKKLQGLVSANQYRILFGLIKEKLSGQIRDLMLARILFDGAQVGIADSLKPYLNTYDSININKAYLKILKDVYNVSATLKKGNSAPVFTFPDMNGTMKSLADFKGKVVYLDIWASWCAACRAEIDHTRKLAEKYKEKDVVFLYVSIDTKPELWQKLIYEKQIPGVHLIAGKHFDSEILKQYLASGIPHYALIDKQGNIVINDAESPSQGIFNDINDLLKQQ